MPQLHLYLTNSGGATTLVMADAPSTVEPARVEYVPLGSGLTAQQQYDAYHRYAALCALVCDGGLNLTGGPVNPDPPV